MESLDTGRPFTRAQALAAGVTPKMLRGARFKRVAPAVYVDSSVPDTPWLRAAAALRTLDARAFASHATAARVLGVPIPVIADEHLSVVAQEHRRSRQEVRFHVCAEPLVREVRGIRVSEPRQLFVELAALLGLVDLVVAGDHMIRHGLCSIRDLASFCETTSLPHAASARRAVTYVRERVDSAMETRLRMLLVLAGLPEPEINLVLRDVDGIPIRRYDLSYPSARTIIEYDGRHHVERVEQWESDLDRREAIDDDGWRLLVVTSRGIYRRPDLTVLRVWRVLRSRGLADLPVRPTDDWRPHFPCRP